jgi:GNAT superfamily N-acetyltransferase
VVCDDHGKVVGYYSLAAGGIEHEEAPARVGHGLARHSIAVVVLTRLAVDTRIQSRGLGRVLLRDALKIVADVSDTVGVHALVIHLKTERARDWYLRQAEFESPPGMPNKLFLLIKDLRAAAGKD